MKKVKNCTKLVPFFARDGRLRPKWTLFTLFGHYFINTHSNHSVPLKYKFIEVLENDFSDKTTRLAVSKLTSRCIEPGLYYIHITNWLKYFTADKILFLDGEAIAKDPVLVMRQVVKFLYISVRTELENSVRFETKK